MLFEPDPRLRHAQSPLAANVPIDGRVPDVAHAARRGCANPGCRRGWLCFFKDHRRPIFEGRWACSGQCMRVLVERAIRRESPAAVPVTDEHRHRIPLGLVLLTRGWVTQPQLQHALAMQRQVGGGRIGRWLMEECGVPEERILNALALQWHCNVFSLRDFNPSQMALAVPRQLIEHCGALPLRVSGAGTLRLGFCDRPDTVAAFAIERMAGVKAESGLVSHADCRCAREALLGYEPAGSSLEELPDRGSLCRRIASDIAGMQPRASRLVRVRQFFWLRMWLEDAALRGPHGHIPPSHEDVLDRVYMLAAQPAA